MLKTLRQTWPLLMVLFVVFAWSWWMTFELREARKTHAELVADFEKVRDGYYKVTELQEECEASLYVQFMNWEQYRLNAAVSEWTCRCLGPSAMRANVFECLEIEDRIRGLFEEEDEWQQREQEEW